MSVLVRGREGAVMSVSEESGLNLLVRGLVQGGSVKSGTFCGMETPSTRSAE